MARKEFSSHSKSSWKAEFGEERRKEGGTVDPESDSAISAVFFIRVKGASHLSDQEAASRFLEYKIINVQIEYCTRIAAAQAD